MKQAKQEYIGKHVTWISQSSGTIKEKTGQIIAMISKCRNGWELLPGYSRPDWKTPKGVMFDPYNHSQDRYLILVQDRKNTFYYAPRASTINKILSNESVSQDRGS